MFSVWFATVFFFPVQRPSPPPPAPLTLAAITQATTQPLTYSRLALPSGGSSAPAPVGGQEAEREGQSCGHRLHWIYVSRVLDCLSRELEMTIFGIGASLPARKYDIIFIPPPPPRPSSSFPSRFSPRAILLFHLFRDRNELPCFSLLLHFIASRDTNVFIVIH